MSSPVVIVPDAALLARPEGWARLREGVGALRADGAVVVVVVPALAGGEAAQDRIVRAALRAQHGPAVDAWVTDHRGLGDAFGIDADALLAAEIAELDRHALGVSVAAGIRPATHARVRAVGAWAAARLGAAILTDEGRPAVLLDPRQAVRAAPESLALDARPVLGGRDPEALPSAGVVVVPGGIAGGPDGAPMGLRGGAAVTAGVLGVRLAAARVEVWTDAPPLRTADVAWVRAARLLPALDPTEAEGLAALGAPGFSPELLAVAAAGALEVHVVADGGTTRIAADVDPAPSGRLLHTRGGLSVVSAERGAMATLGRLASENGWEVALLVATPLGISAALAVPEADLPALQAELVPLGWAARVGPCVAVTVLGSAIRSVLQPVGTALEAVGRPRLRLVAEGADDRAVTVVVDDAVAEPFVRALHGRLFGP